MDNKNMKIFLRETNIWRLIGGGLIVVGVILLLLFPSSSFGDIIVYRTESHQWTIWNMLIMTGAISAFLPTIIELLKVVKELILAWRQK